jgi:hypothetical protein
MQIAKKITLRRDGKGALQFTGERIGHATRTIQVGTDDEAVTIETSARLFKTPSGKYVAGIEQYDKTNEQYEFRFAEARSTLEELLEVIQSQISMGVVDNDILGELFEGTARADRFIEQVD